MTGLETIAQAIFLNRPALFDKLKKEIMCHHDKQSWLKNELICEDCSKVIESTDCRIDEPIEAYDVDRELNITHKI